MVLAELENVSYVFLRRKKSDFKVTLILCVPGPHVLVGISHTKSRNFSRCQDQAEWEKAGEDRKYQVERSTFNSYLINPDFSPEQQE